MLSRFRPVHRRQNFSLQCRPAHPLECVALPLKDVTSCWFSNHWHSVCQKQKASALRSVSLLMSFLGHSNLCTVTGIRHGKQNALLKDVDALLEGNPIATCLLSCSQQSVCLHKGGRAGQNDQPAAAGQCASCKLQTTKPKACSNQLRQQQISTMHTLNIHTQHK